MDIDSGDKELIFFKWVKLYVEKGKVHVDFDGKRPFSFFVLISISTRLVNAVSTLFYDHKRQNNDDYSDEHRSTPL